MQARTGGPDTRARGAAAEELAARWLARQGFRVLARNHATRRGEVDLVCSEGDTLCFVEVRSGAARWGSPAATVTAAKARRVVAAAADWALRYGGAARPVRFDVVAVCWDGDRPRLDLLRGAFDAGGPSLY
jgi:putative endonuclease